MNSATKHDSVSPDNSLQNHTLDGGNVETIITEGATPQGPTFFNKVSSFVANVLERSFYK